MSWFMESGKDFDIALSSRIRLARNIEDYPFPSKCSDVQRSEIISKVSHALAAAELATVDPTAKSNIELNTLVEKHYISPEFAREKAPRALMLDEARECAVMVCEEDHVRIQSFAAGLALKEAWEKAVKLDEMLDSGANIAYNESLGYLTHCPTNLGTGMRASVMLHLPALKLSGKLPSLIRSLTKLGITTRGIYGEGSESAGALYQISNSVTLGQTEEETLEKLEGVVARIIENERQLRGTIKSDSYARLCDRVMRARGILSSAYMLSTSEFMELWSDVRLGTALGLLEGADLAGLTSLMIGAMQNNLLTNCEITEEPPEAELSVLRAKFVRENIR